MMKERFTAILLLFFLGIAPLFAQQDDKPVVTIYTSWQADQEGAISFSVSGEEADYESVFIDAGYGKTKPNDTTMDGEFRVKGNVIKIYGKINGLNAPNEITRRIVFAENDHIKDVAITMSQLDEQVDLRPCKALRYVSFMGTGLKKFDFALLPESIEELFLLMNELSEVAVPALPNLTNLNVGSNKDLAQVDVSLLTNLVSLDVSESPKLTTLDVSKNKHLTTLNAFDCNFRAIDLTKNDFIDNLSLANNRELTEVKFGNVEPMAILDLGATKVPNIDVTGMPSLVLLTLRDNPNITKIDLSKNSELVRINLSNTAISKLDVKHLANLNMLNLEGCPIKSLDLSGLETLTHLSLENSFSLEELILDGCTSITDIIVAGNNLSSEASKRIANALPTADFTMLAFYLKDNPKDKNWMLEEDVKTCVSKGWSVLQKDANGETEPYSGIPTSSKQLALGEGGVKAIVGNENVEFVLDGNVSSIEKELAIYDIAGRKVYETLVNSQVVSVSRSQLGEGVYLVALGEATPVVFVL